MRSFRPWRNSLLTSEEWPRLITESAGAKASNWIKAQARKDPDQLLYVVVDEAVRYSTRNDKPSK